MVKKRITHVISDSNVGGAGILLKSIASALADEFDIEIFLPRGSALCSMLSGIGAEICEVPMSADRSFCPADTSAFRRLFATHRSDIVHTHGALSARLGARLAGIRHCLSTRHCAIPTPSLIKKNILKRKIYNFCTDLTVSTAEYATENLVYEGVPREKILTIKNGVAKRQILSASEKEALKARIKIPSGAVILGCCARLEAVKGHDLIISAVSRLAEAGTDVYLLIVGTGTLRSELERLCARLGIAGRTRFVGFAEDPTPYQNIFTVNVNASRGTETSCLATSECMSLGIPTVASDFGGNTEMITHEKNGLIFKNDNVFSLTEALRRIISDTKLYFKLCSGAFEIYESCFSIKRMSDEYAKLYRTLTGN